MEVLPIPLQRYLHSNRPHLKASQLETCCMPAYRLSYVRAPDYSGEAARQASNGSFDFSVLTLQSLPPPTGRGRLKEAQKKGLEWWNGCRRKRRERCVKRKGTLRGGDRSDGTLGNGREETERRRKHERAGESRGRLKTRRARTAPRRGNDKLYTSFRQTNLFISFSISSCPLNVDTLQLPRPGSPALCFLCLTRGIMGVEVQLIPGVSLALMEECCCLPRCSSSQLEMHLWAFLSSLPARSKPPPPQFGAYLHFPVVSVRHTQKKNKVWLIMHSGGKSKHKQHFLGVV